MSKTEPARHFVTAKAAIWQDGKLLMLYEGEDQRKVLGIPGGRIEAGEDPIAGLKREVMEELGVEVEVIGNTPVKIWSTIWTRTKGVFPLVALLYECRLKSTDFIKNFQVAEDEDIMEVKFVDLAELEASPDYVHKPFFIEYFKETMKL